MMKLEIILPHSTTTLGLPYIFIVAALVNAFYASNITMSFFVYRKLEEITKDHASKHENTHV